MGEKIYHEFMAQHTDVTDFLKELVPNEADRNKIKEIIKNEQKGNKDAKGTKCK